MEFDKEENNNFCGDLDNELKKLQTLTDKLHELEANEALVS